MIATLLTAVREYLILAPVMAAIFLGVLFLVALLQMRVPQERVRGLFQQRSAVLRYGAGAAVGAATPF